VRAAFDAAVVSARAKADDQTARDEQLAIALAGKSQRANDEERLVGRDKYIARLTGRDKDAD
jgi:hypothetical protein